MIRKSRERPERQALAAFAVVVPVLLLPGLAFGLLLHNPHVITNDSHEGARPAIVLATPLLFPNPIASSVGGQDLRAHTTRKYA